MSDASGEPAHEAPATVPAKRDRSWIPATTGVVGARSSGLRRRLARLRVAARRHVPHDEVRLQADPVPEATDRRWGRPARWNVSARLAQRRLRRRATTPGPRPTPIEVSGPEDGVLTVRLAGGARRNVLGRSTVASLDALFASPPHGTKVILLLADPPDFCAGYDLVEAGRGDAEELIANAGNFESARSCTVPVVAGLGGNVIGGGLELALLADIRIAATGTRFAIPASQLGLVYSTAGVSLLVSLLGESAARAMLLAGRVMEADAALAAGLVVELVPPERLEEAAQELAATMATWSAAATSGNRQVLDAVVGRASVDAAELRLRSFAPDGPLAESIRRFAQRHGGAAHEGTDGQHALARAGSFLARGRGGEAGQRED